MDFINSDTSRVGSAPDESIVNSVSDTYNELMVFMQKHGRMDGKKYASPDSTVMHQFLDRSTNIKYRFDSESMIQFFELLDTCRRDSCVLHILEYISDSPAGIMIDFDRKQDYPAPSIFTIDTIYRIVSLLASVITEVITEQQEPKDIAKISEETRKNIISDIAACSSVASTSSAPPAASSTPSAPDAESAAPVAKPVVKIPQTRPYHIFVIKRTHITRDPSGNGCKDGIHLLVPEIWLSKSVRKFIVGRVRDKIGEVFDENTMAPIDPLVARAMVDMNSACVSTHLLGSCKIGGISYNLAFAARVSRSSDTNTVQPMSLDPLLNGYNKSAEEGGVKINLTYELSLTQYMPTFRGQPTWLQKRIEILTDRRTAVFEHPFNDVDIDHLPRTQARTFEDQIEQLAGSDSDAAFILNLVNALPIQYAQEYQKWRDVLMAIADTSVQSHKENYKILAQHFSMRAPDKWDQASFERMWNSLCHRSEERSPRVAHITLHSLEYWVRSEDPAAYEEAKHQNARGFLMSSIVESKGTIEHVTIAEILFRFLRGLYAVDTDAPDRQTSDDWYEFVMNDKGIKQGEIYKWRRVKVPHDIYRMCSLRINVLCHDIYRDILNRAERATDDEQKKRYMIIAKTLDRSIKSLGKNEFQEGTLKQLKHLLNIRGFVESLDKQPYVVGVGNGVLEFLDENNRERPAPAFTPRLIRGYHEIRIMSYTDVDYEPYDEENPFIREILGAYHDIYIEPDVCEFMLMYISTWLDSCDVQRTLVLLGGGGSNGKTWSVYFPQVVLGQAYVRVLKMQLLTDDHEKARDANSALMQLKGLRGGYFDEANEGSQINPARVKSIVTPGFQSARDLYSREEQFRNTANTIAISNYDFIINATDNGSWDRFLFYQCKSRFVQHPDPASPYEKIKQTKLTTEWPKNMDYKRAMLSILVHYRQRLEREYSGDIRNIPIPTIVAETKLFRAKQDPIERFIVERLVKSSASNIPVSTIADCYRSWYRGLIGTMPRVANLETIFQNSRIGEFIKLDPPSSSAQVLHACGIRIRENNRDSLCEGETYFE